MRVRRLVIVFLVIAILAFLGLLIASRQFTHRPPEGASAALAKLQQHRHDYLEREQASADLVKAGKAAYPGLAEALKSKDSGFDTKYGLWRGKLPSELQGIFPERASKTELRRAVASSVHMMGPAASRALVGAIEYALEPSEGLSNMEVLRTLYWSIPESPKAIQVLSNWLAQPQPGLPLLGMKDAREMWPTVPHLAPLLAPWLKLADSTAEAAEALGLMGTNASFAIPLLIEVAENGVVGGPGNAVLHSGYAPELATNVIPRNKAYGIAALGELGIATPEVLEALRRATTNDSPLMRARAASALGNLGRSALPALPHLLAHLDEHHNEVLRYQLEAIGNIGPGAKEAVPALLRFSDASIAASVPEGPRFGSIVRWEGESLPLHLAAAVSLAQIVGQVDPGVAKVKLPVIALAFETYLLSSNSIVQLRPLRSELLPLLEPTLNQDGIAGGAIRAFNVLVLDRGNRAALGVLKNQMRPSTNFEFRSIAARYYFHATGDAAPAVEVFRETLKEVKDLNSQTPINLVRELGPSGRPLAPLVSPLLEHENHIMRMLAGKALRSIAPEAMPPICQE